MARARSGPRSPTSRTPTSRRPLRGEPGLGTVHNSTATTKTRQELLPGLRVVSAWWRVSWSAAAAGELLAQRLQGLVRGERAAVGRGLLVVAPTGVGGGLAGLDLGLRGLLLL